MFMMLSLERMNNKLQINDARNEMLLVAPERASKSYLYRNNEYT